LFFFGIIVIDQTCSYWTWQIPTYFFD